MIDRDRSTGERGRGGDTRGGDTDRDHDRSRSGSIVIRIDCDRSMTIKNDRQRSIDLDKWGIDRQGLRSRSINIDRSRSIVEIDRDRSMVIDRDRSMVIDRDRSMVIDRDRSIVIDRWRSIGSKKKSEKFWKNQEK